MTDLEQLKSMLERAGFKNTEEAKYMEEGVYTEGQNNGDIEINIYGGGYSGFFSTATFDTEGNLIGWGAWE